MTTAAAAAGEAIEEPRHEAPTAAQPARHPLRDAAVVSVIAITQLAWMALLAYAFFTLLA